MFGSVVLIAANLVISDLTYSTRSCIVAHLLAVTVAWDYVVDLHEEKRLFKKLQNVLGPLCLSHLKRGEVSIRSAIDTGSLTGSVLGGVRTRSPALIYITVPMGVQIWCFRLGEGGYSSLRFESAFKGV